MKLVDSFGRVHRDLRISVTDRCNFRCSYCMPPDGLEWTPSADYLTFEEVERVAGIFVKEFGFDSIRLTGGEPTLRPGLIKLIEKLSGLGIDLAMTTNGTDLVRRAKEYREAGLRRLNISLDTLDASRFKQLTNRDDYAKVVEGIQAASDVGFESIKLNAVLIRGVNSDEVVDFLHFGRQYALNVRFIEFMPLEAHGTWERSSVYSAAEILSDAGESFDFDRIESGSSPSQRFVYRDGGGEFGIIPSVTDEFCGSCDRVRLTCDGQVRNCLFAQGHLDLRTLIRSGASDLQLIKAISEEVGKKAKSHGIGQVHFVRPTKSMSQIGG